MSQDNSVAVAVAVVPVITHTLGHWGRVVAFIFTAGFAYPNVMTEGMDFSKLKKVTP